MKPLEAVSTLAAAFQKELPLDTVTIYGEAIADIEPALLRESVKQAIATCKFFPAVAEVRRIAARIAGLLPPAAGEILAMIQRADVRETIYRRDGTAAYAERYWRWPEGAAPELVALCETVLAKVGEPCDEDGEDLFGWDTNARKVYEAELPALEARALSDLSAARLLPGRETARLTP